MMGSIFVCLSVHSFNVTFGLVCFDGSDGKCGGHHYCYEEPFSCTDTTLDHQTGPLVHP